MKKITFPICTISILLILLSFQAHLPFTSSEADVQKLIANANLFHLLFPPATKVPPSGKN